MPIVAKFKCERAQDDGLNENVSLFAVYSDDPNSENRKWSQWTPGGRLEMSINNPSAKGQFKEGEEYLLTIEPANSGPDDNAEAPYPTAP